MKQDSILIVDVDSAQRQTLVHYSKGMFPTVLAADSCTEAWQILRKNSIALIVLAVSLPDGDGIEMLKQLKVQHPNTKVIIISGSKDINHVVNALRLGASDYLIKPVNLPEYKTILTNTLALNRISNDLQNFQQTNQTLEKSFENKYQQFLVGASPIINQIVDLVTKIAPIDTSDVLITGESGVGKDLVAKAIHNFSQRRANGFYAVNCSSIPETLFESEFFGHTRQAFTGAVQAKKGAFEATLGGTVFLDEIGNLPLSLQSKFLRVLENRTIRPVGSNQDISINVRVLSASNRDLPEMVADGTFRRDLYHRLNAFEIYIPPLRERKEDIKPLVLHFCDYFAQLMKIHVPEPDDNVFEYLSEYDYPGNVRELKNIVRKAIILNDNPSGRLTLSSFPFLKSQQKKPPVNPTVAREFRPLAELDAIEKLWIENALREFKYNVSKTAKALGISRTALNRKIDKYNL